MQERRTLRMLLRIVYLMKVFCGNVSAAESSAKLTGEIITAGLMDPIMLSHMANHQIMSLAENESKNSNFMVRPATPGPFQLSTFLPTTIINSLSKRRRDLKLPLIKNPTVLEPIEIMRERKSSWPSLQLDTGNFYDQIVLAIRKNKYDLTSRLALRPEMAKLNWNELFNLLMISYFRYLDSDLRFRDIFEELFHDIVLDIVPKLYPYHFFDFILFSLKKHIPTRLFLKACKHVNLLSKNELNELIKRVETGKRNGRNFAIIVQEIAINLDRSEYLIETDHVINTLSSAKINPEKNNYEEFLNLSSKIKFVYMSVHVLSVLRRMNSESNFQFDLDELFRVANNELSFQTENILILFEPVLKVFLPKITTEQIEPMGRFTKDLHDIIKSQTNLPLIPTKMIGVEDLFFYVKNNLISLTLCRLKYYRSNRITKGQLLGLLNMSDFENNNLDVTLLLLGMVKFDQRTFSEKDFNFIYSDSLRILIKGIFTFPKTYDGGICTMREGFKLSENILWNLPLNLFISSCEDKDIFKISDALFSLSRLFLYRVFGIPLSELTKVNANIEELPDKRELISVSNFFLERWCSLNHPGSFPLVKITFDEE